MPRLLRDRCCDPTRRDWVTPVELACALSHLSVWKRMIAEGLPRALVLEDDIMLSSRLPALLSALATTSADVVKLEGKGQVLRFRPVQRLGEVTLCTTPTYATGAGAYLLSASGAARLVRAENSLTRPVDDIIFDPGCGIVRGLSRLICVPGLAYLAEPDQRESDIEAARAQRIAMAPASVRWTPARIWQSRFERHVVERIRALANALRRGDVEQAVGHLD